MKRKIIAVIFFSPFLFTISCFSQKTSSNKTCDSLGFKISGSQAVKKAIDRSHKPSFVKELKVININDNCLWHVLLRETYTIIHHEYYSDTFHEYYIDPNNGSILKENGYKKPGEKVRKDDMDYKREKGEN